MRRTTHIFKRLESAREPVIIAELSTKCRRLRDGFQMRIGRVMSRRCPEWQKTHKGKVAPPRYDTTNVFPAGYRTAKGRMPIGIQLRSDLKDHPLAIGSAE